MFNMRMTREKIDDIQTWVTAFLRDCKARELSPFTIEFYRAQLKIFTEYCDGEHINEVTKITPDNLRGLMLSMTKRNEGGRHAVFRSVRAFLRWYEVETDQPDWANPIRKVKPPKLNTDPIPGVAMNEVKAMTLTCANTFTGVRDRAILLCLLDTGARAREFISLNLSDVDFVSGAVDIHKGKGNKSRTVFVGKKSRKALRAYIRLRSDDNTALWVTRAGSRLAIPSLRQLLAYLHILHLRELQAHWVLPATYKTNKRYHWAR